MVALNAIPNIPFLGRTLTGPDIRVYIYIHIPIGYGLYARYARAK